MQLDVQVGCDIVQVNGKWDILMIFLPPSPSCMDLGVAHTHVNISITPMSSVYLLPLHLQVGKRASMWSFNEGQCRVEFECLAKKKRTKSSHQLCQVALNAKANICSIAFPSTWESNWEFKIHYEVMDIWKPIHIHWRSDNFARREIYLESIPFAPSSPNQAFHLFF